MDLIGFLYGFGFIHGLILAGILLFVRSGQRVANVFMAALVACLALRFLSNWLIRTGVFMSHPEWGMLITPLDLAWGPLLYLYSYSMAGRPVEPKHLLHAIPCLLLFAGPITFAQYSRVEQLDFLSYFWSNRENLDQGREVLKSIPAFWRTWIDLHLHGSLFSIQFGVYCYLVLRQIQQHNLNIEQEFSYTDKMNLRWLRILTYLCLLFLLLFLVFNRARLVLTGHFDVTALSPNTPFLFLVLAIYVMGIAALYQPRIRTKATDPETSTVADAEPAPETTVLADQLSPPAEDAPSASGPAGKYARSSMSMEDAQKYKIRLMEAMQEKELYLDCDLTLGDLAKHADLSYHQASQVINGQMNQRFFSFVNNYRIQLAKELMAAPKTSDMAIVDLAMEVGFKSKSSFYDAFKKVTKLTPTQFKKSLVADS